MAFEMAARDSSRFSAQSRGPSNGFGRSERGSDLKVTDGPRWGGSSVGIRWHAKLPVAFLAKSVMVKIREYAAG